MAVSLGTTLSPYMARRAPRVVITGKFVSGVIRLDSPAYGLNYRLFLINLATAASGATFSLRVTRPGEPTALGDYVVTGLSQNPSSDTGISENSDLPWAVRMLAPPVGEFDYFRSSTLSDVERYAGILRHDDMQIIIDGPLQSLSLGNITAGAFYSRSQRSFSDVEPSGATVKYNFPGYGPGTGWRPYEVRIIGQPALRGNVSAPSQYCSMVWDP